MACKQTIDVIINENLWGVFHNPGRNELMPSASGGKNLQEIINVERKFLLCEGKSSSLMKKAD